MIFKISKELLFFLKRGGKIKCLSFKIQEIFFLLAVNVEVIERDKNVLYLAMPNSFHDLIIHNKLHGGICDQFLKLGQTGKYMN